MFQYSLQNAAAMKIVPMYCDKCRTKALKIAAAAQGSGDDVDSVCLTRSLRKKLGCSCTIVEVEKVKPAVKTEEKPSPSVPSASCVQYCCTPQFRPVYCELVHEYPEPTTCSIM